VEAGVKNPQELSKCQRHICWSAH